MEAIVKVLRTHGPGVILGMVAIVIALAGTSIALPGKNKVDGNDLKANTAGAKALKATTTAATNVALPGNSAVDGIATCPAGTQVIAGGGKIDNAAVGEQQFTLESYMSGNGWYVRVGNSGGAPRTLTVEAYCLQK